MIIVSLRKVFSSTSQTHFCASFGRNPFSYDNIIKTLKIVECTHEKLANLAWVCCMPKAQGTNTVTRA